MPKSTKSTETKDSKESKETKVTKDTKVAKVPKVPKSASSDATDASVKTKAPKASAPKQPKAPKTQEAKKTTKRTADGAKKGDNSKKSNVAYPAPPKNKRNAYTFFFSEKRNGVKTDNADLTFAQITAKVAEMWNALPEADKKKYEKDAAADAKRYEKEREKWDVTVKDMGGEPEEVLRARRNDKKRLRNRVKKPKGARNPYVFFSIDKRKELEGENLEFNDMTRRLGEEWAKVSDKDKKKYEKMAEEDKARHDKDMETFRQEHPDQDDSKKSKRRKKEGEPKGARNAYIFFSNEERSKVTADNPKMTPKEVMTELGKRWNDMQDKSKAKYTEMAENDKKRHEKEMKKWTAAQPAAAQVSV